MAKDTRVTFDSAQSNPNKPNHKTRPHNRNTERQISYEDAENCVNEMSESFPALSTRAHRIMRQVSGSFNSQTIKVALILSVILNLLLGIPFGIFFGFWMSYKNETPSVPPTSATASDSLPRIGGDRGYVMMEGCYPCPEIDISLGSKVKVRSKNDICCTDDKLPNMDYSGYHYISAEYYRNKFFGKKEHGRARPPCNPAVVPEMAVSAAHMMLDVEQTKLNVKGHGTKNENPIAWFAHDKEDRAFIGNGLTYADGYITIKHSGKYHLYSHVTWSTIENHLEENEREKMIVHSINRKSRRHTTSTLLFTQVSLKQMEVRSTNLEGTFDLSEGDMISVYVSYPSLLKKTRPANVFGLFQL